MSKNLKIQFVDKLPLSHLCLLLQNTFPKAERSLLGLNPKNCNYDSEMSSPEVTDGVLFQDFTALAINVNAAPKNAVAMLKRNTRNSLMITTK